MREGNWKTPILSPDENGELRPTSAAFGSSEQRISFDRARYRSAGETRTERDQTVFRTTAALIRSMEGVIVSEKEYKIEVYASPLPDNTAHAHVSPMGESGQETKISENGFKKLRRKLSQLVQLVLPPNAGGARVGWLVIFCTLIGGRRCLCADKI